MTDENLPELEFRVNGLVERMQRYIPLDAGADQLVHELVETVGAVSIRTKADDALSEAVIRPDTRLVLLTGDAGHGKTRLCCKLLERLGVEPGAAAETIRNRADGSSPLADLDDGRELRIVKDLSDFDPANGADLLVQALDARGRVTVLCANEGRLRDLVSRRQAELGSLLTRLQDGLRGDAESVAGVLIVNLNFQSVASQEGALAGELLRQWVGDGRGWTTCSTCRAKTLCPIFENRRLLGEDSLGPQRIRRWVELFRIAERTGTVITVRELLVSVAFAITSGLRCEDVHREVEKRPVDRGWQSPHLFFESLFERIALLQEKSPGLRVPSALRRLDPGHFADRRIDESLAVDPGDVSFRPLDPTVDSIGLDWRGIARDASRADQLKLTRFLRRRAFFDADFPGAASRVGLRFGDEFDAVASSSSLESSREIRDKVVRGLAAAQGVTNVSGRINALPIVEPSLAGRNGGVAILERDIRLADVKIVPLSSAWALLLGRPPDHLAQLDWAERQIAVLIEHRDLIALDLRAFELVCAAGDGMDLASSDPGVSRRLLLQLAALANGASSTDRIVIVEPGQRWTVDLDIGDQLIGTRT